MMVDLSDIDVITPSFKRRLSGVTATIARLVPLQARSIAIAACAPNMPTGIPNVWWPSLVTMARQGPSGPRIWHARRNIEMIAGLALKYILRKNLRIVFTSASQRKHTRLTRALIARMDAVIATSEHSASYLARSATIIPHGIDTDTFFPSSDKPGLRAHLRLPAGPLIGCFGRIRPQKGTDIFVRAMIDFLQQRPEASAIVVGRAVRKDRTFKAGLMSQVKVAGLQDRLLFLPEVSVEEMSQYYQALDLYVAPQRWEGFGLTVLEAMACGTPCIATRVGVFQDMIDDGKNGILVDSGDAKSISDAANKMLTDPIELSNWGQYARAYVQQKFPLDKEAEAINDIYRNLLNG